MLEDFDFGTGQSRSENQRGMVELVADNQTVLRTTERLSVDIQKKLDNINLVHEAGGVHRICGETHHETDGIFHSKKPGGQALQLELRLRFT